MKHLAFAIAMASTLALAAPMAPAHAAIETVESVATASAAAREARKHMRETFGKTSLKNGQYLWKEGHTDAEVTRIVVDLSKQMAYAYADGELIAVSTISSGNEKHLTPIGIFPILEKKRMHRSKKYDDAPMPYMQRLDQYGIALHAGNLPGHPASHGCIRLPNAFAAKLFAATKVGGTEVLLGEPEGPPVGKA